jgi:alkanesulfonate monooxygenase SsuD/methylene tetrahydromethanopterin reductase-like flavin-dependent oxidoreductase (luciferase family)
LKSAGTPGYPRDMHFGLFVEEARPGYTQAQAFREALDLADTAEAIGLDCVWLGEIHFNPGRSVISAPMVMATAMASRTRRIHVGTAVQVLPLGNPLRIAEEAATLDQLSEGRFQMGVGRSGAARTYDVLGIPYGESQARFKEALAIIREAWKGKPFSYRGEFYKFENAVVAPRPYQDPHPPLRMAANSPETFPQVAELGVALFVGLRDHDTTDLGAHIRRYRQAWREAGHAGEGSVYLRIPIYAGETEEGAREEARESITYFFQRHAELTQAGLGRAGAGPDDRRAARLEHLQRMTYDEICRTRVAFGSAPALIERLRELRETLDIDGVIIEPNAGGLIPAPLAMRSLRIVAERVLPAFK